MNHITPATLTRAASPVRIRANSVGFGATRLRALHTPPFSAPLPRKSHYVRGAARVIARLQLGRNSGQFGRSPSSVLSPLSLLPSLSSLLPPSFVAPLSRLPPRLSLPLPSPLSPALPFLRPLGFPSAPSRAPAPLFAPRGPPGTVSGAPCHRANTPPRCFPAVPAEQPRRSRAGVPPGSPARHGWRRDVLRGLRAATGLGLRADSCLVRVEVFCPSAPHEDLLGSLRWPAAAVTFGAGMFSVDSWLL